MRFRPRVIRACTPAELTVFRLLPALEAVVVGKPRVKPNYRRRVLRLPDLDHCKTAVLNSLGSPAWRRVYEYAIETVHRLVLLRASWPAGQI